MKHLKQHLLLAFALLLTAFVTARCQAADMEGPYVYKTSVHISTRHYLVYWANPNAKEPQYLTGTWAPKFDFNLEGPLESGSQISVAFLKADGTKWFSQNLKTEETAANTFQHFQFDGNEMDKVATPQAGTFTMMVNLANGLNKTNKTLYTAKFIVEKFHYGSAPNEKNQADFYVNHDWALPLGQMSWDTEASEEVPRLLVSMWFRGGGEQSKLAGYLFYQGKQIASTKDAGGLRESANIEPGTTRPDLRWRRMTFDFASVAKGRFGDSANSYPDMWFLDKHPGEYEIKMLREGKLARSAKFTIGEDGKLVDNGLAAQNKMGKGVVIFPVTVEPGLDGKTNTANYKTQAYYGNSLVGFP